MVRRRDVYSLMCILHHSLTHVQKIYREFLSPKDTNNEIL